jgi:hypothetical protein
LFVTVKNRARSYTSTVAGLPGFAHRWSWSFVLHRADGFVALIQTRSPSPDGVSSV